MTVLVDSDILIEVSRANDPEVLSRWTELSQSDDAIRCSPVGISELWTSARTSGHRTLTNLFDALICAPIDAETGRQAGEYLRRFRKSHGLELGDALIASSAVLNRATLWTRNRKHYPMKDVVFF